MKKFLNLAMALLLSMPSLALAQNSAYPTLTGNGSPVGVITCSILNTGQTYTDQTTGLIWTCNSSGAWQLPTKQALASPFTVSGVTFQNVTGIVLPVAAGVSYFYICYFDYQVSTTSVIPQIKLTGPSAPTYVYYTSLWQIGASTSPVYAGPAASAFGTAQGASPTAATTNFQLLIHLTLLNGVNAGAIQLQTAAPTGGSFTLEGGACSAQ
jgi:hypothetical protein